MVLVKFGATFSDLGDGVFEVDPANIGHFTLLMTALDGKGLLPNNVVHLLSGEVDGNEAQLRSQLARGPYAWLNLTRAVMNHRSGGGLRLLCLMSHREGCLDPVGGGLFGFARTLQLENPSFHYQLIAHDPKLGGDALNHLIQAELSADETLVRYRNGVRERFVLKPCELEEEGPPALREGGVCLIIGGAGGIGFLHALARQYRMLALRR